MPPYKLSLQRPEWKFMESRAGELPGYLSRLTSSFQWSSAQFYRSNNFLSLLCSLEDCFSRKRLPVTLMPSVLIARTHRWKISSETFLRQCYSASESISHYDGNPVDSTRISFICSFIFSGS